MTTDTRDYVTKCLDAADPGPSVFSEAATVINNRMREAGVRPKPFAELGDDLSKIEVVPIEPWRPTEELFPGVEWRHEKKPDCEEYNAVAGGIYVCFHSVLGNFCGQTWPGDWNEEIRRPPEGLTPSEELTWFRMQCLENMRADAARIGLVLWKRGWGALGEGISIEQAARMNTEDAL